MHHSSRSEPILKGTPHPYSPYGIRFEDEKRYHKQQQQRYKEDLDYLISLRQKNNSLAETLREQRRIERMNDKYNYERLSQKSINKEFDDYNTREANNRRMERQLQKQQRYKEYLNDLTNYNNQINYQLQIERAKKERIRQDKEQDLQNFRQKKEIERLNKLKEHERNKTLFQEESERFLNNAYDRYKDRLNKMNNKIFNNAMRYSDYIQGGNGRELYYGNNDYDYNRKVAEMHAKEKHDRLFNVEKYSQMRKQEYKEKMSYEQKLLENKLHNQKSYKDFLDYQNKQKQNEKIMLKKQSLSDMAEQLLMPSYNYPNLPKAVVKKACDPLGYYSRTPGIVERRTSPMVVDNNSMSTDIGSSTVEYKERPSYLGDSRLRHNPITCPVDDIGYNRYVIRDLNQILNEARNNDSYNNTNINTPMQYQQQQQQVYQQHQQQQQTPINNNYNNNQDNMNIQFNDMSMNINPQ